MRTLLCIWASLGIVLLVSSCAAFHRTEASARTGVDNAQPAIPAAEEPKPQEEEEDKELKRCRLQRSLTVAREKVRRAELALAHQSADTQGQVANAERAHELAARKLAIFQERDAPLRVDESRLSLQRAQDRAKEQEEELEQLEMLYTEQDLAEKTAEIVLQRGRRRLERARRALQLETTELENLEQHHLPLEHANLQKEVDEKARELEQARRKGQLDRLDKQIALMEAEAEVAQLEAELAAVDKQEQQDKEAEE